MEPLTDTEFMLNTLILNVFKIFSKVTSTLGFCPFYVDTVQGKLRVDNWCWARTLQNWLWLLIYGVIVLPTHIYELHTASKDFRTLRSNKTIIYLLNAMVLCWMFTLFLGGTTLKPLQFCQFLNSFLKYVEMFPKKYITFYKPKQERKKWRLFEFLVVVYILSYLLIIFLAILHCYIDPTAPAYPAFNVPSYAISLPVHLLSSTWFSVSGLNFTVVTLIFSTSGLYFFFTIFPIIRDELRMGRSAYKTIDLLREPYHLVINYRAFQILMKTFNLEIGIIFVPIQMCITLVILICNVSLTYQWDLFGVNTRIFLAGLTTLVFEAWVIFIWLAGWQYQEAEKTVKSWKLANWSRRKDRMYMQRVKLTCQPITFGDGKRFLITPMKVLKFFNSVSKNTFRAFATYAKTFGY
ncbi:unnamed protein product [Orchesella dallaii]|uniref:Odorant receptor n=1 Tax=Orchesella dallaii TaxID=48710 RepID=A0ABP1Q5A8_9HEXA